MWLVLSRRRPLKSWVKTWRQHKLSPVEDTNFLLLLHMGESYAMWSGGCSTFLGIFTFSVGFPPSSIVQSPFPFLTASSPHFTPFVLLQMELMHFCLYRQEFLLTSSRYLSILLFCSQQSDQSLVHPVPLHLACGRAQACGVRFW